jgi:glycosidase
LTECGEDIERVKQVYSLLLTFIGTPCIYYGDEIGLTGGQDPGCRKCMEWDWEKQNRELFEHIQKLIQLRDENPLLANDGELSFVSPEYHDICLAYTKTTGKKTVIVILNTSNKETSYTLPFNLSGKTVKNLWNHKESVVSEKNLTIKLKRYDFAILEF